MKLRSLVVAMLALNFSVLAQPPCKSTVIGDLRLERLESKIYDTSMTMRIWLPVDYSQPSQATRTYPTLYMLDGQTLFDEYTAFKGEHELRLDEAVSKIDDVASRDMTSDFFPNAVHILADGAARFLPQLKSELDKSSDEKEKGAIIGAIDYCNQIIEASAKVKRETPKEIKKRKEKEKKDSN